ncbi:vascular endothelial growth factor receptor 2 isoform X1 [Hypanus sabinus]|uniref:vascular endothelial growth factor receptor 2 isoform X1 n=2 Tax=Hypanus sabinus TaxID=79690 RepID=UPI0028C39ACE|nr:vascular endothelial growth factor receptor 2 isoform X1 [Hypanus sabinus]
MSENPVFALLWLWFGISDSAGFFSLPHLSIQNKEHVINANDTLIINCSGHGPVEWSWPRNHSSMEHRISLTNCSKGNWFCKTLILTKTNANDTGMYRCYHTQSPIHVAASIYVFVQDDQMPFVNPSDKPEALLITESKKLVVPCKVSIPNLNVTLHTKYPENYIVPDGTTILWDNKNGFIVLSQRIRDAGLVQCETTVNGKAYHSNIYVLVVVGYMIYNLTLNKPSPVELSVGERLMLNCTARTELNVRLNFDWDYPGEKQNPQLFFKNQKQELPQGLELSSILIIDNVKKRDEGRYICHASSGMMSMEHSIDVIIHEKPFIFIDHRARSIIETVLKERNVKIPVKVTGYPQPEVKWTKNGRPISKDHYKIKQLGYTLMISGVTEKDAGNYTIILRNPMSNEEQQHTVQLLVNVPPEIHEKEVATHTDFHSYGSRQPLTCTAYGIPAPSSIIWEWQPVENCSFSYNYQRELGAPNKWNENENWRNITDNHGSNKIESSEPRTMFLEGKHKVVSTLVIQVAEVCAMYRCRAVNKVGEDQRVIFFPVTKGLEMNLHPTDHPIEKDNVSLQCRADRFIYENLKWYKLHPTTLQSYRGTPAIFSCEHLKHNAQEVAWKMSSEHKTENITIGLSFINISLQDQGVYLCEAQNKKTGAKHCVMKTLSVEAQQAPLVLQNLTDQTVNMSSSIEMKCDVAGAPRPHIIWYKNEKQILEASGIVLGKLNRTLTIQRLKKEDEGTYKCEACNMQGCAETYAAIAVEGVDEKTNVELIILIGTGVIATFFWLLLIIIIRKIKRPSDAELKTGYLSIIMDPDEVPMDKQYEQLSYDASKWEFPRDRLKLGKPLGCGAFGKVIEAAAFNIEKYSTCTTVAVKMLKEGATFGEQRALMSELKILIHIGHHLNVVNLLGACTKVGGPLMVIVEYCKYGNLSNYLRSKRNDYVPYKNKAMRLKQIKEKDPGEVDSEFKRRLDSIASSESSTSSGFAEDKSLSDVEEEEAADDFYKNCLTLEDLISYSFQTARGMEFLASRKCIHRDLAARNVLLSENNVVKICDFGLARDVYKDPDYVRKGDALLPLKWMAPETIFDKIYTTQSDVWSFGILLWEIFSLGASPYPGVQIDEEFCQRLKEGTRMRCPQYATTEIYHTMLDCWHGDYKMRPIFSELVEHLGNLLQTNAQQDGKDYIPLNMSLTIEDDSGLSLPTSPTSCTEEEEGSDSKFHYDNTARIRYINGSKNRGRPEGVKTFDEETVQKATINVQEDNQTDSGMILASEELKTLDSRQSQSMAFSALIPSKSKESVSSEVSNQTSGYQSGYHSDDTDTAPYSNEEAQPKENHCNSPADYNHVSRYSAPPV